MSFPPRPTQILPPCVDSAIFIFSQAARKFHFVRPFSYFLRFSLVGLFLPQMTCEETVKMKMTNFIAVKMKLVQMNLTLHERAATAATWGSGKGFTSGGLNKLPELSRPQMLLPPFVSRQRRVSCPTHVTRVRAVHVPYSRTVTQS